MPGTETCLRDNQCIRNSTRLDDNSRFLFVLLFPLLVKEKACLCLASVSEHWRIPLARGLGICPRDNASQDERETEVVPTPFIPRLRSPGLIWRRGRRGQITAAGSGLGVEKWQSARERTYTHYHTVHTVCVCTAQ